jgi:hypothetical protein
MALGSCTRVAREATSVPALNRAHWITETGGCHERASCGSLHRRRADHQNRHPSACAGCHATEPQRSQLGHDRLHRLLRRFLELRASLARLVLMRWLFLLACLMGCARKGLPPETSYTETYHEDGGVLVTETHQFNPSDNGKK